MSLRDWLKRLLRRNPMPASRRPNGEEPGSVLARLYAETVLHLHGGNVAQAEACCRQAGALMDDLARAEREPARQKVLAAGYYDLGSNYKTLGRVDESEAAYQRALALWIALPAVDAGEKARFRGMVAACHN